MKRLFASFVCGLCFLMCLASIVVAEGIVLIDKKRSQCTIVTGKDDGLSHIHSMEYSDITMTLPARVLELAAKELADRLSEIGWIGTPEDRPKIVAEINDAKSRFRILLGSAAIAEYGLEEEAAELSYSAYVYKTEGTDLLIFGRTSKGTANGVYGFIQDELGVRWFGPQEHFTIVPRMDRIEIGKIHKKVEPSFTGAFGAGHREDFAPSAWARRMRLAESSDRHNRVGIEPFSAASHHVRHIVSATEYFDEHPEYFIMRNGKRWRHPNPGQQNLCWTNPDVIEKAAQAAKARFRQGEQYHIFAIGIADADAYCECPECVKLQPERFYRGRSPQLQRVASDMYFHFVNGVARKVKEEFPDRYLGVIAYNDVSVPPLGAVEDNVFVQVVIDVSEHYDEAVKKQDEEFIREWQDKNITLGMYYYTGLAKLVPAYFPHRLAEVLKNIHKGGFRGLRAEVNPGWPWTGPMVYADARLWWDVNLDVDELLHEYFTGLYGDAAPFMQQLYELFEEIHMRPRGGGFLYEHYSFAQFRPYTGADLARMKELLGAAHDALQKLGTDTFGAGRANLEEQRLAYTTNGLRLFLDMLEGLVIARELEEVELKFDDVGTMMALRKVEHLNTLLSRHIQVYREAIMYDKYQSSRYRWDTCVPVRAQWKEYLSRVAGDTLVRISNETGAVRKQDRRIGLQLDSASTEYIKVDSSGEALIKLGTGEWHLEEENLIQNPGFEENLGKHPPYPEHLEWRPAGADSWAYWQKAEMGAFTVSDEKKRSGKHSAQICGVGSGVFLTLAPDIIPGGTYFFEAFINNFTEPEDNVSISVSLDWLGKDNQWLRKRLTQGVDGYGDWTRVNAVIKAPEAAAAAVVIVSVGNLPDRASIYVDDVSLRKIVTQSETALIN